MIGTIKNFKNNSFLKNIIILMSGSTAAQIITMTLSPIITRLYGPEAFGLMGVFNAILGILAPIAALTIPFAIVLPKNDIEAKGLIRLSLYISGVMALIASVLLILFLQPIVQLFQIEEIASFLYLIPIVIIVSGFLQVVEQWLIRTKQFSITAKATILQALVIQGSKVGIGYFSPFASVLIILTVLNQAVKAFFMIIGTGLGGFRNNNSSEDRVSIIALAKQHKDFFFFRTPQTFIDSVTQSLPILLLSSFFGATSVAFYSIGKTVLYLPTSLIGKSVGDVFYSRISEAANNNESLTKLIQKATLGLIILGFIPFGFVIMFGPWLFSVIFGLEWEQAGEYARWIAFWSFSSFIISPSLKSLPVLRAQAFHLRYTVYSLIIRMIALFFGSYIFSSDLIAVALFGGSSALLNIILILITLNISKKHDRK